MPTLRAAVVGGGPAGLMAAEALSQAGIAVDLFDAMPSVGRKFLLAGIGGLNLTHSEPLPRFVQRYRERAGAVGSWLDQLGPDDLRRWAADLGIETFVGSSGRVFPTDMKAAPLLRAWLQRLRRAGVSLHMRHRWVGWAGAAGSAPPVLVFETPTGEQRVRVDAVVLALGGGSWPRLGSDARWLPLLEQHGVDIAPLRPANCGFDITSARGAAGEVGWSDRFRSGAAGRPLKTVAARCVAPDGTQLHQRGEFVFTETGVEGSLIYALSAPLRELIARDGSALLELDLLPDHAPDGVLAAVAAPRGSRSLSSHLKSRLRIDSLKTLLLHELLTPTQLADPATLAAALKALPLRLAAPRPIAEAISSAGGVRLEALDRQLMLERLPGVFCAGEMLDWEAPTGGYLLSACFASGRVSGQGAAAWLAARRQD